MNIVLNNLEKYCYKLFYEDFEITKFEDWVYSNKELEDIMNKDDYIDLISLDFKSRHIKSEIEKVVEKYIDYGKFEKKLILTLLYRALKSKNDLPDILMKFYYMYCHGYIFFEDLGLGYGLTCEVPPSKYTADTWYELNEEEKDEIIDTFYPKITVDIKRAIDWIENDKIVLLGTQNELEHWEFLDNRNVEEKKSNIWVEVSKDKKWWQFWNK
ncbi:MAG: hypothetical protein N4A62_03035 [Marinisporobacter sp.]|jgi:hypothetical protein|nr:hypothetical protein [Marinisporobacter sp.]